MDAEEKSGERATEEQMGAVQERNTEDHAGSAAAEWRSGVPQADAAFVMSVDHVRRCGFAPWPKRRGGRVPLARSSSRRRDRTRDRGRRRSNRHEKGWRWSSGQDQSSEVRTIRGTQPGAGASVSRGTSCGLLRGTCAAHLGCSHLAPDCVRAPGEAEGSSLWPHRACDVGIG